jgi:hypothetical protein
MNGQRKMRYIYTTEYYSAIKNETVLYAGKWMKLSILYQMKLARLKDKHHVFFKTQNLD